MVPLARFELYLGPLSSVNADGNVPGAARLLRSTRETLRYRVEKFALGKNLSPS